jgi:hypothetical protein
VRALAAEGRLAVLLESRVVGIEPESVEVETPVGSKTLPNDTVIVCAGGILPTALLGSIGVQTEVKRGAPIH